jgi:hypothetical protein
MSTFGVWDQAAHQHFFGVSASRKKSFISRLPILLPAFAIACFCAYCRFMCQKITLTGTKSPPSHNTYTLWEKITVHRRPNSAIAFLVSIFSAWTLNTNMARSSWMASLTTVLDAALEQLMLDHNSRSATVRGHIESINILFKLCNFDHPANLSDHTNMCTKIFVARGKE